MVFEMKDGFGSIHKNKFKKEGDKTPDRRGEFMWRGEVVEVAGWLKKDKNGEEFLSIKVQEPREKPDRVPDAPRKSDNITSGPQPIARRASADMDDEIPF
jgi:hypothetical protein